MGSGDCKRCNLVAEASPAPPPKPKTAGMKVLKKIKRKIGIVSRSSSAGAGSTHPSGGSNNLPPLLFHAVHGDNVRVSRDGAVARRVESFCKGVAFSARPVRPGERVHLRFVEVSANWSGVLRFGFTSSDPSCLRHSLPRYACPDLTNKPGHWAKALPERFCSQGAVLSYHVTSAGDVHFAVDGDDKGVFFGGVETRGPLWALVDVYGNSTAVEFMDPRRQLNNSRENAVERITYQMQQLQVQENSARPQQTSEHPSDLSLPLLRYQPSHVTYQPMPLHRTKGRNVRFINSTRSLACRADSEICQGYVFTARPLQLGERVVVQILATEPMFQGCLGLGLTSCDPASLQPTDLPDDSNFLLDRPEYWVISRDFARNLNKGDEISFCISVSGEVQISRNGGAPLVVIHVDETLRLWAFFDIYGSTQRIRVLSSGSPVLSPLRAHADARRLISPTTSESINSLNTQSELNRRNPSNPRLCYGAADVQVQPVPNGGAVLSVILPPTHANLINQQTVNHNGHASYSNSPMSPVSSGIIAPVPTAGTGTMISSCSSTYVEPISCETPQQTFAPWPTAEAHRPHGAPAGAECTICYENAVDAVLYMCGHMCMCYECALQQWKGKGGGHCPLCRAVIRDVIRTYKA